MGNRKELVSSLQELREDNIRKQKRGLKVNPLKKTTEMIIFIP